MKSPRVLLANIADKALQEFFFHSSDKKVGHYINKLSPHEREVLKTLTSNDIKNDFNPNGLGHIKRFA